MEFYIKSFNYSIRLLFDLYSLVCVSSDASFISIQI